MGVRGEALVVALMVVGWGFIVSVLDVMFSSSWMSKRARLARLALPMPKSPKHAAALSICSPGRSGARVGRLIVFV